MERWRNDADGVNRSTGRKTSPNVTLSITNLTCTDQGWNSALRGERLAILGWDLISVIYIYIYIYIFVDRGSTVVKVLCYKSESSIPDGVIGIFHGHNPIVLWPWGRLSL